MLMFATILYDVVDGSITQFSIYIEKKKGIRKSKGTCRNAWIF